MFHLQIKDFLEKVCNEIKYKPIREEISKELENHIEESKEAYIHKGESEEIAINKAIADMGDAEVIGKTLNKIHKPKLDYKLIILLLILLCFTFLVVGIKTTSHVFSEGEGPFFVKTIVYLIIGFILGLAIYFMDYTKIAKYSNYIYIVSSILIIYTVISSHHLINGIPYLNIGNIYIPINRVVMPLFLISFIGFIQNVGKHKVEFRVLDLETIQIDKSLIKIIILSVFSLLLLASIPSLTSAFILGIAYMIIATVKIIKDSHKKVTNLLKLCGVIFALGIICIISLTTAPYRLERIVTTFYPETDPEGAGWLGINRKLIIESASMFGEAEDMSNALDLFDAGTQFAFISILAHYGWIVAILLIVTIILISIKLIINSIKVKDAYGKMIIIGISCLFIFQSVFNVLMNLNLWFESGFELPFVSYGGTGLIMNMACLALVLSIYRRKDILISSDEEKIANSTQ